jgi:AcrR family transcriptional regulator
LNETHEALQELIKPPLQDRSRKTLNRIVKAALDLIAERGVDGASVQDIARRARASVGSFYARFQGKEDLLRYLEVQLWADARSSWTSALETGGWDELSFEDLVATVVQVLVEVDRTGARQRRLLESRRGPGTVSDAAREFDAALSHDIRHLLLRHSSRIDHPDPARAVDVCIAVVTGALRHRASGESAAPPAFGLNDEEWTQELSRMSIAYLAGAVESGEGKGQMDFFEIWG